LAFVFAFSLLAFASVFSFLVPASALLLSYFHFKCFFLASSYSQTKEKKTIEKKTYAEKGGSLPLSSRFAFSLLTPTSALSLLHFHFKCFPLASSSSQAKKRKKTQRKKKP
jgi:hypothetical protein